MKRNPQFQVLEGVERLPGYYMWKNGELVPYDGADNVNQVVLLERWKVRDCKDSTPPEVQEIKEGK